MASFFRRRIAENVFTTLQKRFGLDLPSVPKHLKQCVLVTQRLNSPHPVLTLPWQMIERVWKDSNVNIAPQDFLKHLKNQGLPSAEGFLDITMPDTCSKTFWFTVDKHIFSKIVLHDIITNDDVLLRSSCLFEDTDVKNVVVQFCAPAIGEQFSMTHFRSAIHTNFLAKINQLIGHNVIKVNHVHDWGLNAAILLTGYKRFNIEEGFDKSSASNIIEINKAALFKFENDLKFKDEVNEYYKQMKAGNPTLLSDLKSINQVFLKYNKSLMERIGINFDETYFDSLHFEKFEGVASELRCNETIFNKDGSYTMDVKIDLARVVDQTPTDLNKVLYHLSRYITAANQLYEKHNCDTIHYIAPSTQDYLPVFSAISKRLSYPWAKGFEHVRLTRIHDFDLKHKRDPKKLFDQAKSKVLDSLQKDLKFEVNDFVEDMAERLSLSSIIMHDFRHPRSDDYVFEWKRILNLGRDTAASFMFCLSGLKGLSEDTKIKHGEDVDTSALLESDAHSLIVHLSRFDEVILRAYVSREPYVIYHYICTLGWLIEKATDTLKLDEKSDRLRVIKARLYLFAACAKVLEKSLDLLNIFPLVCENSSEQSSVQSEQ